MARKRKMMKGRKMRRKSPIRGRHVRGSRGRGRRSYPVGGTYFA